MRSIAVLLLLLISCKEEPPKNMKDLEQSMMDLKLYQENLGDDIRAGKLQEGEWLLEGVDSILNTVSETIIEHHKLKAPFSYYKRLRMNKPMKGLKKAFKNNDTALARRQYIILVDQCNNCHIDLDIDKEVRY